MKLLMGVLGEDALRKGHRDITGPIRGLRRKLLQQRQQEWNEQILNKLHLMKPQLCQYTTEK